MLALATIASPIARASIDVGIMAGRGVAKETNPYVDQDLGSWYAIGPEVIGSLWLAPAFSVGFGLGYQAGLPDGKNIYGERSGRLRHELSTRVVCRYKFLVGTAVEHDVGAGAVIIVSRPSDGGDSRGDRHRVQAFVSYRPSFRVSESFWLSVELLGAYGPKLSGGNDWVENYEFVIRPGVEYRF